LTDSVKEALILEQNLIKKYQPRFNILLRDDHTYPYIKITADTNPRYYLAKKADHSKRDTYYGPFPDGTKATQMLQVLERLFPLAKCQGNLGKPCLYYSLNQCSGHCFQLITPNYYQKIQQKINDFFQGKTQQVKKQIQKSFQKSLDNCEFELAKKEKKLLDSIDFFVGKQNMEFSDCQNYDFLGFYSQNNFLACYFLLYRYGKFSTYETRIFKIPIGLTQESELLQSYLYQFYQRNLPPKILYLPKFFEGIEILAEEFNFAYQVPEKGQKKKILLLAQKNAAQNWQTNCADNFQRIDKAKLLEELGQLLQITPPFFIEVLDVSNLFQQDVIAGFLACVNGEVDLSKSKTYHLSNTEQKSDVAWIAEACRKHYSRFQKSPRLLIIDGGKAQVRAALKIFRELKLSFALIGLAKDDQHQTKKIIAANSKELNFPQSGIIKNFLAHLQTEVHRFVITKHRKIHRKNILKIA